MGGSRCSKLHNYWNIMVTFLVSGIWHGANWTFILWGVLHGAFQVVEKAIGQNQCRYTGLGKAVKIIVTMFLVTLAWIFFRLPSIGDAVGLIGHILDFNNQQEFFWPEYNNYFITFGVLLLLIHDMRDEFFPKKCKLLENRHKVVRWMTYIALLTIIMLNGVLGSDQFIYANF